MSTAVCEPLTLAKGDFTFNLIRIYFLTSIFRISRKEKPNPKNFHQK